ncbi:hypothetical protein ACS0TY_003766 [Phlomoides rotata]
MGMPVPSSTLTETTASRGREMTTHNLLTKAIEDALIARGIPDEPPRAGERGGAGGRERIQISSQAISRDDDVPPEETKPPSQDMEESNDNAPPAVVTDQLEAFRREIKAMRKQIYDWKIGRLGRLGGRLGGFLPTDGDFAKNGVGVGRLAPRPIFTTLLNYKYDGTTYPYEHLMRFENSAILHRYGEGEIAKSYTDLIQYEIRGDREFEIFSQRLNQAALEVPTASLEVKINALTNELRDGDLFYSLAKKHVATFDDLLRRAEKYITLEEKKKAPEVKPADPEPIWEIFRKKF